MEELYEIAFGLILHAGNARSQSIQAVKEAEKGDFTQAEECMKTAREELHQAHEIQTGLLQEEAGGDKKELNLLMVHAQDHLAMAMSQQEVSLQIIHLYKRMEERA